MSGEVLPQCTGEIVKTVGLDGDKFQILGSALNYCYARSYFEAEISREQVRQALYLRQIFENEVMLWMVVIITLSGVVLAAFQLLASYKLAVLGKDSLSSASDLTIEHNKIALKSSVTGLLILTVSLAFFAIYVTFVFTLRDPTADAHQSKAAEHQSLVQLPDGAGGSIQPGRGADAARGAKVPDTTTVKATGSQ
ncbi:hypothetical protein QD357_01935 [Rhizobium sp. BR 317]|uniref:hypothetical protein n=1 Tax=Rhizobium sp. BR 317 TaxID=3040015 RepID=UPI0039BF8C93